MCFRQESPPGIIRTVNLSNLDPTSRRVVETVLRHGPISRIEMVERTGLSSGSLTRIATPLVKAGILTEGEAKPVSVGRPSMPLEVADDAARFLGIKVVPGRIYAVLVGLRGAVHGMEERAADTSSDVSTAQAIASLLREESGRWQPVAVGVSLAAAVDVFGTVRAARLLGWQGGNIADAVREATGLPAVGANDVDALALSEHWFGHGRGTHNFVVLTMGMGVGAGAIVEGTLVTGHQGAAAMLGRAWTSDGRTFHDVLATGPLLERASAAAGRALELSELSEVADSNVAVCDVVDDAAVGIGELVGLATLAFGPERILITGDGIAPFVDRLDGIQQGMMRHSFFDIDTPEIVMGNELDFFAWARGGAALAIHHTLR